MDLTGVWACGFCVSRIEWTMTAAGPARQIAPRIPFSWWALPAPDRRLVCDDHLLAISGGLGPRVIYTVDGVEAFNDAVNADDEIAPGTPFTGVPRAAREAVRGSWRNTDISYHEWVKQARRLLEDTRAAAQRHAGS